MLDRYEVRRQLQISPDQKVLLYVGRVAPEKNLGMLLDMAAKVMAEDASVRLFLVGDGPARQACADRARLLGIGDRVTFAGFVPRSEVDLYYAAADLFVFSSITETQGLVVQEAMTYGLPAVAVTGGGASDSIVTGENGFVVRNDVFEFAETVSRVLEDESLYSHLSSGAQRTVRINTASGMTERVVEVYREVLGRRKRSESNLVRV